MLAEARLVCGIDTAKQAIDYVTKAAKHNNIVAVNADACALPFSDNSFTKAVSQDADAWLTLDKEKPTSEAFRVLRRNGLFVFQSYAQARKTDASTQRQTCQLLQSCGYRFTDVPTVYELEALFASAGFVIVELRLLHELYSVDNERMLDRMAMNGPLLRTRFPRPLVDAIHSLLEWERSLFEAHLWTGVLIIAKKP